MRRVAVVEVFFAPFRPKVVQDEATEDVEWLPCVRVSADVVRKKAGLIVVEPAERCRVYYMGGRWWLPPSSGRGVSRGPKCPWFVPTPKGVPEM